MQLIGYTASSGSVSSLSVTVPATFEHLIAIFSGRSSYSSSFPSEIGLRFNGDSGSNYSYQIQTAINTTIAASSAASQTSIACGAIPNDTGGATSYAGQIIIDIANYKNTTFYKSAACCQGWTTATTSQGSYRNVGSAWTNTAAITSVAVVDLSGGNFKSGSTLWVYGY